MPVIRVEKNDNYTTMCNFHLRDKRLSLRAKGLLSEMLSLRDDWKYSVAGLASINKEKEDTIKSILKELKDAGYLIVNKFFPSKENGGMITYEYVIHEKPVNQEGGNQYLDDQHLDVQPVDAQPIEKPLQLNTNILNTKEENTKVLNTENKKKERKKEMTFDEILDSVPVVAENPDLRETFIDFIKMRKLIKHPLTDRALKGIIKDTYKLGKSDPQQMILILEQSIKASWQGVFPLREEQKPTAPSKSNEQPRSYNPFTELKREEGMI